MDRQPLVSVIIPVYNAEMFLEECMTSVLGQTYTNLEVILVDDGSADASGKMCDAYAKKDPRVRVIHKENGGPMSACLDGVKAAQGEYLAFVDSDDWVDAIMIEELVKKTSENGKEIICSNYVIEKAHQSVLVTQSMQPGTYDKKAIEKQLFPDFFGKEERRIHGSRCMKLISGKLLYENLQYADLQVSMGEDMYLILLAVLDAERLVVAEGGYYYHYRFVEHSLVHKYNPHFLEEIDQLYDKIKDVIEKKVKQEKLKETFFLGLKKEYIFLFFFLIKNELRGKGNQCYPNLRKYVKEEKVKKGLDRIEVEVSGSANRLLYLIWKKPSVFRIGAVRAVIKIFDKI